MGECKEGTGNGVEEGKGRHRERCRGRDRGRDRVKYVHRKAQEKV
jgi:hypothetical protein